MAGYVGEIEKECPECHGPIDWKLIYGDMGSPCMNGLCKHCNIILRNREPPDVTEGKRLEREGEIDGAPVKDMDAMDKRITRLSVPMQLGILRERQKDFHDDE